MKGDSSIVACYLTAGVALSYRWGAEQEIAQDNDADFQNDLLSFVRIISTTFCVR